MLADLRLEGGAGTCRPPSVKPGPQVIPGLGELNLLRLTADLEVFFFSNASPSGPTSDCDSLIVLEGDPGVGGVFDREDLRVENVKLVVGRFLDSLDGALLRDAPFVSIGAYWSTTLLTLLLLRLRKLLVFVNRPGLFSLGEVTDDGEAWSTDVVFCNILALLLMRRERGVGGWSIEGVCDTEFLCCSGGLDTATEMGMTRGVGFVSMALTSVCEGR